jgi:alkanesulfonate monooxygenase SsuD/methylene tetrahydromethanopterin reductase-like flavin-dependent oxidoreductase (luciferase family)
MGTSVTLMPLSHPFQAALQARSLAALTGQPVVAGLGTGPQPFVRALRGQAYASPLTAVREYASTVRGLLAGDRVDLRGEYHAMSGALTAMETPPVELGLGVLRPRMAELAGELADVAITWLTPPDYLAEVLVPALTAGAERAGRPRPRVTSVVHVSLDAPDRDHLQVVAAASHAHLRAPHYADMLVDSGTAAVGSADEILRAVSAYRDAGADEVVLSTIGLQAVDGTRASLEALDTLTEARRTADA